MVRSILALILLTCPAVASEAGAGSAEEIIAKTRAAIKRNLPDDFVCRIDCALLQQLLERRLPAKIRRPVIRLYWKAPGKMRFVIEAPGLAIPAQLMANMFLHQRLSLVMARLGLGREKVREKTFIIWLDKLAAASTEMSVQADRGRASNTADGLVKGRVSVLIFSGLRLPFPIGGTIRKVKLWIDMGSHLPRQVRLFTSRTGVLTVKIAYQMVSQSGDPSRTTFMLPSRLTLIPSPTEDGRTAAYPISARLTEWQVNTRLPDALFDIGGN